MGATFVDELLDWTSENIILCDRHLNSKNCKFPDLNFLFTFVTNHASKKIEQCKIKAVIFIKIYIFMLAWRKLMYILFLMENAPHIEELCHSDEDEPSILQCAVEELMQSENQSRVEGCGCKKRRRLRILIAFWFVDIPLGHNERAFEKFKLLMMEFKTLTLALKVVNC